MKLAIITCKKLPHGVADDACLFAALKQQGIQIDLHAWNDEVDWSQYQACLLRSVWDYHENSDAFLTWLKVTNKTTPFINAAEVVQWNTNKKYLKELSNFGVSIAPTVWLKHGTTYNIKEIIKDIDATQYFLKPVIGADSSGTLRFTTSHQDISNAQNHLENESKHQDMMLQPYLKSVETSGETSGIFFGGQYSHGVRKTPINGDYRVQDTFGAIDTAYTLNPAEMALSKACLSFLQHRFGSVVYARFDYLHDSDGTVYLNEAELFEPSLFFNQNPKAASIFSQVIKQHIITLMT